MRKIVSYIILPISAVGLFSCSLKFSPKIEPKPVEVKEVSAEEFYQSLQNFSSEAQARDEITKDQEIQRLEKSTKIFSLTFFKLGLNDKFVYLIPSVHYAPKKFIQDQKAYIAEVTKSSTETNRSIILNELISMPCELDTEDEVVLPKLKEIDPEESFLSSNETELFDPNPNAFKIFKNCEAAIENIQREIRDKKLQPDEEGLAFIKKLEQLGFLNNGKFFQDDAKTLGQNVTVKLHDLNQYYLHSREDKYMYMMFYGCSPVLGFNPYYCRATKEQLEIPWFEQIISNFVTIQVRNDFIFYSSLVALDLNLNLNMAKDLEYLSTRYKIQDDEFVGTYKQVIIPWGYSHISGMKQDWEKIGFKVIEETKITFSKCNDPGLILIADGFRGNEDNFYQEIMKQCL